ncbi:YncE family protein [Roseomonas sp. ACRSG]|nr:YncE family protein [Roseomonas sp. ACRSG]
MTPFPIRQGLSRRQTLGLFAGLLAAAKAGPALAQGAAATPAVALSAKVGTGLYEIVFSRTTGLVHVAAAGSRGNSEGAGILALDPKTLALRGTIDLSEEPAFGLGLNDRTGILYTTNTRSGSVSAIDLKTGKTLAKMAKGEKAHVRQVVADEEKNRAFVSVPGFRGAPSAVWVIDGAKQEIVQVIEDGLGEGVSALTLDAAGNRLFGASLATNEVVEIGLADGKVARRFPSGGESAINIAYQPKGNRLFVANQKSGTLTVLDAASGSLVKSIETGAGALGVTLAPNGTVYVTNRGAGTVSLVDGARLEVIASLATGTHPNTVAIDRETGTAYVSNKARMTPRGQPPVEDPNGDTVSIIRA